MNGDQHYPTVDFTFLSEQVSNSPLIIPGSAFTVGDTTTFILHGKRPIYKRTILVRQFNGGQVSFIQATGLAIRLNFMGALLHWFEENKNWKDGAYFEPPPKKGKPPEFNF